MTIARIREDKDAKNTKVLIILLVLLVLAIWFAGLGKSSKTEGSEPIRQSFTDSPVGYP